jgi:hypothetical protein
MTRITASECVENSHSELRLASDMSWACHACGATWGRHETPLIFVNEMAIK